MKTGYLNQEQTRGALMMKFTTIPSDKVLERCFRMVDSDNDGLINKCEFDLLCAKICMINKLISFGSSIQSLWIVNNPTKPEFRTHLENLLNGTEEEVRAVWEAVK